MGAQLLLTPTAAVTITLNGMVGPERANRDGDPRSLFDATATWKASDHVTLGANGDWGAERGAVVEGREARWSGGAGYARASRGKTAVSLRAEIFDDHHGARTGTAQRIGELTVTPEVRLTSRLLVRADLRIDHSNHDVFEKGAAATDSQSTILVDAIYHF